MSDNIETLLRIMTRLRDPKTGCPWDIEQNFKSILPYTIEEAYEVAQAIQDSDMEALLDELGDLLLQVVFHAEIAREAGHFDFNDVAKGITEKMIRRHPHVFSETKINDADQQSLMWETQKANERSAKAKKKKKPSSALDGVALALPSLVRAQKLQKRARRLGFDWQTTGPIIEKIAEELAGGTAVGLSGKDGKLLEARRLVLSDSSVDGRGESPADLGFVGEPAQVNIGILQSFEKSHIIPVVAPIGVGPAGETYNINADTAAGAIASAMLAAKLIMLTDVAGVLDETGELISTLDVAETEALLNGDSIKGGMIPKLKTCLVALKDHCEAAHILDGRVPHSLLLEIFTAHGTGTMIVPGGT